MSRLIKGIALAFFATVLPCFAWATEATPTPVLLLDFGVSTTMADTNNSEGAENIDGWKTLVTATNVDQANSSTSHTITGKDGNSYTVTHVFSGGGKVFNNGTWTSDFATGGTFNTPDGATSYGSALEEMKTTLGLSAAIPEGVYKDTSYTGNGGDRTQTVTITGLNDEKYYVLYFIGAFTQNNATPTPGFQLTTYGGTPVLYWAKHTDTSYTKEDSINTRILGDSQGGIIARVHNLQSSGGKLVVTITSTKSPTNAIALAETEQIYTWTPTSAESTLSTPACWSSGSVPEEGSAITIDTSAYTAAIDVEVPANYSEITIKGHTKNVTGITFGTDVTAAPAITISGKVKLPIETINDTSVTLAYGSDAILIADVADNPDAEDDATLTKDIAGDFTFWKEGDGTLMLKANISPTNGSVIANGTVKFEENNADGDQNTARESHAFGSGSWKNNGSVEDQYTGKTGDVLVKDGAILDINGHVGSWLRYVTLEAGATYANLSTKSVGNIKRQCAGIILEGNATVNAVSEFGLVASDYAATKIELNNHILTKTGSGNFILRKTAVSDGILSVTAGNIESYNSSSSFKNVTFDTSLGTTNAFVLGTSAVSGTVTKTGTGSVTIGGEISGSGNLAVNGGILILTAANKRSGGTTTIADGATLKLPSGAKLLHISDYVPESTGRVTVSGVLELTDWSYGGSLGNLSTRSDAVILDGGTLKITGTASVARLFNVEGNSKVEVAAGNTFTIPLQSTDASFSYQKINVASQSSLTKIGAGAMVIANPIAGEGAIAVSEGTLTLSGANTYTGGTEIASGATLNITNASALGTTGDITGAGTLECTGVWPTNTSGLTTGTAATADAEATGWTGTVKLTNVTTSSELVLNNYGHADSTVCFNGVTGGHFTPTNGTTFPMDICLEGNGWKSQNGNGNATLIFTGDLSGSGILDLTHGTPADGQCYKFTGDVSDFSGSINLDTANQRVSFGCDSQGAGTIGVAKTMNVSGTWTVNQGVKVLAEGNLGGTGTIVGTLELQDGATLTLTDATDPMTVTALSVAGNPVIQLPETYDIDYAPMFPVVNLASAATEAATYAGEGITVKVGDTTLDNKYYLSVAAESTGLVLTPVDKVATLEEQVVDAVPTSVLIDSTQFGYGEHTIFTFADGIDASAWDNMEVIGLPDDVTIVKTETSWGFKVNTLVIYPIGDSITHGRTMKHVSVSTDTPGGYRLPLYNRLQAAGYKTLYVGDRRHLAATESNPNPVNSPTLADAGQDYHSGHSAWYVDNTSRSVYANVAGWSGTVRSVAGGRNPDVILLLLGVNDLIGDASDTAAATTATEMKALIWRLAGIGDKPEGETLEAALYPNARIVLAKVLPSTYNANLNTRIDAYNTALKTFVDELTEETGSDRITLIDLNAPLDEEYGYTYFRYDNLHPAAEGYSQMARNWFAAIESCYPPANAADDPTVTFKESHLNTTITLSFSKAMKKESVETVDNYTLGTGKVTSVKLLDDLRSAVVTVSGAAANTANTLTVKALTDTRDGVSTQTELSVTMGPAATRTPSIPAGIWQSAKANYTLATYPLDLVAEWGGFDNTLLVENAAYWPQFGATRDAERPWTLSVLRNGENAPVINDDGTISLNGGALYVTTNPEYRPLDSGGAWTVLVETEGEVPANAVIATMHTTGNGDVWKDLYGLRVGANGNTVLTVNAGVDSDNLGNFADSESDEVSIKDTGTNQFVLCFGSTSGYQAWVNGAAVTFSSANARYTGCDVLGFTIGGTNYAGSYSGSNLKIKRIAICQGTATTEILDVNYVAEVNGTGYMSFADANAAAGSTHSIELLESVEIDEDITVATSVTGAYDIEVPSGVTLTITNAGALGEGTITGAGTIVCSGVLPTNVNGLNTGTAAVGETPATGWTGTVELASITGVQNLDLRRYGNAASTITLNGVSGYWGYVNTSWPAIEIPANICIAGANTFTDGYSTQLYKFTGAISGTGSLDWTGTKSGAIFCFTKGVSGFTGSFVDPDGKAKITIGATTAATAGGVLIVGEQEINCRLAPKNGITIADGAILKGAGTLASDVTIQTGATIDATDPTKILTLAEGVEVVWPDQGTLNVTVPALPTEEASVTLFKQTVLADGVKQITTLSVTPVGGETVTSGYQVEAKASVGYVLALRGKENPVYSVANEGDLTEAIAEIKKITDADVNATVNLTAALTGTTALTSTLVIDIGDTNSLTINMAGHAITAGDFTAIQLVSGQLTIASAAEAAITRTSTAGATILVAPLDTTLASPTLTLEAGVKVNANTTTSESAAVDLQIGTIGGAGTLNGNLKLAHNTTIDATIGHLTIADSGIVQFPGQVSDGSGGLTNSNVYVLMPEGLVYPQEIIKCANASADHAPGATLYVDDIFGNNYGLTVMLDNQTGDVSAYGLKQYVCVASTERYTTVAAAIADKQTNIYLHANPVENIVIPDGVTLNLAYLGVQYTVIGNVTVQDGGCLRPMGGDVFGNVTFDSGSTLDVAYDLQNVSTTEFIVGGKVTFPASDFVVVVGSAAEAVAIGEPRQIIRSAVPLEYSTISVTNLQIATGTDDDGGVTEENDHTKIVTTSFTYEVVNVNPGACSLDGIDYVSVEQALTAFADAGNDVITLNEALAPDATIVINVDDPDTEEIEEVTIDLNGHNLTSTADPAIRIQSGKLNLVSTHDPEEVTENPQITGSGLKVISLGADADDNATVNAALHVDASVSITSAAAAIDVVSGTLSGNATLNGNLLLRDGAIIDASTSMLTIGTYVLIFGDIEQEMQANVSFPENGTITVIPPAGSAYPVQFIACPGADATNYANTDLLIKMGETLSQNFTLDVKTVTEGETTTATGYAIATNYAVVRVDAETRNSKAYYATFAAAFVDDPLVEELDSDILVLLANVAVSDEIAANIYTNGYNLSGTGTISGSLTLSQGTEIPTGTSLSASNILIVDDELVTINGSIASESYIICAGMLAGTGAITGDLLLADGAAIVDGASFSPTGETMIEGNATVTIDGTLSGSLYVPHATIEGEGAVTIGDGNTLTGAGTIEPTVTFVSGAIIDKSGFEEEHLVLSAVTALTDEVITVKATDLAHVLTAKNAEAPFTAANFTVDMGTSGYVAYNPEDPADYDNNLVIQAVAYNNGHTLGIVKLNYYIGGARLANPTNDAGVSVAKQLAAYGYRYGILEIKGIDTASSDPVAGFQLFTNVVNGFVGNYLVITYDFGVTGTTIIATTEIEGEDDAAVTTVTKYVLVTAEVDGVYDSNTSDTRGHADYRDTTTVELCTVAEDETLTPIEATEITVGDDGNADDYGLTITEIPAGVKYFVVPYDTLFPAPAEGATPPPSETIKLKVKASASLSE